VRDGEDYRHVATSAGRDARGVGRAAGGVATRTSGRLLQGSGEDRAQAGMDHRDRRERQSHSARDRETASDRGAC